MRTKCGMSPERYAHYKGVSTEEQRRAVEAALKAKLQARLDAEHELAVERAKAELRGPCDARRDRPRRDGPRGS